MELYIFQKENKEMLLYAFSVATETDWLQGGGKRG